MNIKEIKEMIDLMNENGLTELEIEKHGLKIRLRKGADGAIEKVMEIGAERPLPATGPAAMTGQQAAGPAAKNTVEIKSPMVGTFYKAPSPDAPPFVRVGDEIEAGQVVCIIEAMKLMNEIKSEVKGKVISTTLDNADPVEFGQTLFLVEKK